MKGLIQRGGYSLLVVACIFLILPLTSQADPTFVNAANPNLPNVARGVPMGGALRVFDLELDQFGVVSLDLERFAVFAEDATFEVVKGPSVNIPDVAYFRGIAGDDLDSVVMLAIPAGGNNNVHGIVTSASGAWLLEGLPGANPQGIKNRKVDLENELAGRTFECGTDNQTLSPGDIGTGGAASSSEAAPSLGLPVDVQYTAHMIIDTDYEFWERFWNLYGPDVDETAAQAIEYLGDLLAYASIPYEREINTNLLIDHVRLFADNTDPYSLNSNACGCEGEGKLDEVQDVWSGNSTSRTLVHFISGKTEGCGCAYVGVLCSQGDGYGASSSIGTGFDIDDPGFMWEGMVIAHEIGHNFNSPHTHSYCNEAGIADPVDVCVDSCLDPEPAGAPDVPGLGTLTGGTAGDQNGTIMSYCHQRTGSYANIAHTFGEFHPYGVAAWRVPGKMLAHVAASAACMGLDYEGSDVRVFKDCKPDEPMLVGETATCTISVQNAGPQLAHGVVAVDEYLSNGIFSFGAITVTKGVNTFTDLCTTTPNPQNMAGTVTCDIGIIDAGHTAVIEVPVTANVPQNINDSVTAGSDTLDPDTTNNMAVDEVNVVEIADVEVFKDCKPDEPMNAGETGICTITVKNWGPSIARDVALRDAHVSNGTFNFGTVTPGSCSKTANPQVNDGEVNCSLGDLNPGEVVEVVVELLSDEGQNINDIAVAETTSYDPDTTNNSAGDGVGIEPVANLALTKTAAPSPTAIAGTQIVYDLTVTNNGPSTAENVVIADVLPAGVSIDSVASPDGSCTFGVPGDATLPTTCNVDTLVDGASASMQITVTVLPETLGILGNNAKATSDLFDPDTSDNIASAVTAVEASADLAVVKSDDPDPVAAGGVLNYFMTVNNNGPSTATGIVLHDMLPAEVTFDGYLISDGAGICMPSAMPPYTIDCYLDDLAPGAQVTVTFKTLVDPAVPDGTILTNEVSVAAATGDPDPSNNSATEETTVIAVADLWLDKTGNFPTGNPSGTILYYLTVYNRDGCSEDDPQVCGSGGPSDALNVVVVDTLPEPSKKVSVEFVSENCLYDEAAHTVTCTEPVLHAGDIVTFEIQISVKGGVGELNNTADVSSSTTDPDSGNNHDELLMIVQGSTGDPGGPGGGRGRGGGPKK